jgi:hypothetical protein
MGNPIRLVPGGGSVGSISGRLSVSEPRKDTVYPMQVVGFIPLTPCDYSECRVFNGHCYINPVFGTIGATKPSYDNDSSSFFINDSLGRPALWTIQKLNVRLNKWETLYSSSAPTGSGTYYPYGSFPSHLNYTGLVLNWGHVLSAVGAGFYRIIITATKDGSFPYCLVSETFHLLPFSCELANHTVKFEAQISGKIGSIDIDGFVFDLCGMNLYDSIRMKGFFGHEKSSYDSVELEYNTGLIDPVRDEILQKFTWESHLMPKYLHDRFKTYGLMADILLVSDYNFNNSDYNIKGKRVVKAGAYDPIYYKGNTQAKVKVDFKEGIQGVIKSSSC